MCTYSGKTKDGDESVQDILLNQLYKCYQNIMKPYYHGQEIILLSI